MEVLLVGAGDMGRWFAQTLAANSDVLLAGADDATLEFLICDTVQSVAETTAASIDAPARTVPLDDDQPVELVCIAVPISATADAIEAHAGQATEAIVDLTGVMATPLEAMAEFAPEREHASFHPLFAPENAPGNVPVAVSSPGPTVERLYETLEAADNSLVETTPTEHDTAMETIQSAAHAAVLAYGLAAEEVPAGFETPVSAALDELVEQVTGNDARVYAEIQSTFAGADRVAAAASDIAQADQETFETLYAEATEKDASDSNPKNGVTDR